ncbi:MAG: zinc metallopeptidase, partial [Thermoguttaceae bacterium]|nr:zinc metallopeptidase [Thermoguttaceae bacterium]
MGTPTRAFGGGMGTLTILGLALLPGVNPQAELQPAVQQPRQAAGPPDPAQDELAQFVSVALADTEHVRHQLFAEAGRQYREPKLVLFTDRVQSACGMATDAVGPFYCPADEKLYIDLSSHEQLPNRLDAPRDFAQACVIAQEVGHHVQNLLGISDKVNALRVRLNEEEFNQISVRMELQADFCAGVWAHHAKKARDLLEQGDIEEAIGAAEAIGDDRLQRQSQGYVVPDSLTHGTSEQRVRWFRRGFETGD